MGPGVSRSGIGTRGNLEESFKTAQEATRSRPRPISTGWLNTLRCLHHRPIKVLFSDRPYSLSGMGGLILGRASRLDAFSGYPHAAWLPGAPCRTAGRLEAAARRSSRTERTFPSGGQHPRQVETDLSRDGLNPSHVPL